MHRRAWAAVLTVAFVFASGAFLAQNVVGQASSHSISGQVCAPYPYSEPMPLVVKEGSGCNGEGIPKAEVRLTGAGGVDKTAQSDDAGFYIFTGLADGAYHVRASHAGFDATEADTEVAGNDARLFLLLKAREVTVEGAVRDPAGSPIAKAIVTLCCGMDGERSAETGADGAFRFTTLAGWRSLNARAPGFQDSGQYSFFDGAAKADLVLQPVPPQDARIVGTVRDQEGRAVEGARVFVSSYNNCCYAYPQPYPAPAMGAPMTYYDRPYYGGENWTLTDAEGRFAINSYSGGGNMRVEKEQHATAYVELNLPSGQTTTQDVVLLRFPDKTAHIHGRIVDAVTGKGLRYATLNLRSPQFGASECSMEASAANGYGGGAPVPAVAEPYMPRYPPSPSPYPMCAITIHPDGTFDGDVTPGYAILNVWYDSYRSCTETRDADGDTRRSCGPEYLGWSKSLVLAGDADTEIRIDLHRRPEPDAVASGYLVDESTGKAIGNAQINFNNQDNSGYGYATTDGDGSYRIRLRSGFHMVSVYADGYLPWEGVVDVPSGEDTPFDVMLTPGRESYGGCCSYPIYGHGVVETIAPPMVATPLPAAPDPSSSNDVASSGDGVSTGDAFEDLGGGLGPYDAEKRAAELAGDDAKGRDSPAAGLLAALAALGAVLALRRRLA